MNILYFFPHPFYPVKTGAHVRAIQALGSLSRLGHRVSCAFLYQNEFPQSPRQRRDLSLLCEDVYCYEHQRLPDRQTKIKINELLTIDVSESPDASFPDYFNRVDETMRRWMSETLSHAEANVVFIPYPSYRSLLSQHPQAVSILELYDTDRLNWEMQSELQAALLDKRRNLKETALDSPCLQRSFLPSAGIEITPQEAHCIRSFEAAIGLTESDHSFLRQLGHSISTCIPIMIDTQGGIPDYSCGQPCLMMGPNFFNLQGLLHFSSCVMPHLAKSLAELRVNLYGTVPYADQIRLDERIYDCGFVTDISESLRQSSFFINPVFSGTGMQIKTIEAMAHGLAVVCYEEIAEASGVQHGVNGYVAKDERDFASGIALLSGDRRIAELWGIAARDHIDRNLSQRVLDQKLKEFMDAVQTRFEIP